MKTSNRTGVIFSAKPMKPFTVTPALDRIIYTLSRYHVLTSDLAVLALGSENSYPRVKTNLKHLREAGYLFSFPLATRAGKRPNLYVLADKAVTHLEKYHSLTDIYYKKPSVWLGYSDMWFYHPLELNKFIIAASTLERVAPLRLHGGKEQAAIYLSDEWEHDFELKSKPLYHIDLQGVRHGVILDGVLPFYVRWTHPTRKRRYMVVVEIERQVSNKNRAKFEEKITDIYHIIDKGIFEKAYGIRTPKVAFVTPLGEDHVELMRMITRETLKKISDDYGNYFYFGAMPPLQGEAINPLEMFLQPYWLHSWGEKNKKYPLIDLTETE